MLNAIPLWVCSKCGRPFANRNQSHSCVRRTRTDFLKDKPDSAKALFDGFVRLVEECGPILMAPAKTRVGFQVKMIFASVNRLTDRALDAHVILARRFEHPRFRKIESLSPGNHVHHFRIHGPEDLDDEVRAWLREAYEVGCQKHLSKPVSIAAKGKRSQRL
jgi:hypothetical protein